MTGDAGFVPFDEWAADAGLIEPVFVDEPDGFYTHRAIAGRARARFVESTDPADADVLDVVLEPLNPPLPKTRRALRWRPAL